MIFPFLNGVLSFSRARATWMLVLVNTTVMVLTHGMASQSQTALEKLLRDDYFRDSQGHLYAQFIEEHPGSYSPVIQNISEKALEGDGEKIALLGTMAIRDDRFVREAPFKEFYGDQVAVENWRDTLVKVREIQSIHPSYVLGLSAADISFEKWLSYIFVHSGFVHFFGNMLFLVIFGCALEAVIGGFAFLMVFLCSGVLAAGAFIIMTGTTAAPLVGASGAVSGIMALFACLYWRQGVRFVYWLFLPFRGYAGFVWLPGWVVLLMWLASDMAGYLGTLSEFGGVAYAAHLGGEATGVLVGAVIFLLRYKKQKVKPEADEAPPPIGKLFPFDTTNGKRRASLFQ